MTEALINVIVNWLPLLAFLGLFFVLMRRMQGPTGMSQGQYMHEIVAEYRRQNEALLKIIDQMDQRLKRLEERDRKD